jgi:hypothetical protein
MVKRIHQVWRQSDICSISYEDSCEVCSDLIFSAVVTSSGRRSRVFPETHLVHSIVLSCNTRTRSLLNSSWVLRCIDHYYNCLFISFPSDVGIISPSLLSHCFVALGSFRALCCIQSRPHGWTHCNCLMIIASRHKWSCWELYLVPCTIKSLITSTRPFLHPLQ